MALGMLSRWSQYRSQVGSSCAVPAADPGAPRRAGLEQSCPAPDPGRAPRAPQVSLAFFLAFALDLATVWDCWRETQATAAACIEWLPVAPAAAPFLPAPGGRPQGLRGHCRRPSRSHSCSSCRRICSGRPLRSPVRPALSPQGRVARRLRAHS